MDYNFYNVTLFMDCIALVLSGQLCYFNLKFNSERKFDTLAFQTLLVVCSAVFEGIVIFGYIYFPEKQAFFEAFNFYTLIFYSSIFSTYFKLVYESASFVPKVSSKILYLFILLIYILTLLIAFVSNVKFGSGTDGVFQYTNLSTAVFSGTVILAILLIVYCVIFAIVAEEKKDLDTLNAAIAGILVFVFFVVLSMIMRGLMGISKYPSIALLYNISFTFVYMIYNANTFYLKKKKEAAIESELKNAADIQMGALSHNIPAFPHHEDIDLRTFISTAREVGGDFYDYYELDQDHVAFVMADVSGKGIPAALFMMNAKNTIKTVAKMTGDTDKILTKSNRIIAAKNTSRLFVTVWMGIYNTKTGMLQYTNAGHNAPVITHADGEVSMMTQIHGTVLGPRYDSVYGSDSIKINPGDRIFLYTDGLTEAHNYKNQMFGEDRMNSILREYIGSSSEDLIEIMDSKLEKFVGKAQQFDDITMMAVQF